MWWGAARARVRVGTLPDSDVPLYCLEYNRYFDRPYLYGPPAGGLPGQPGAVHVPVARLAGAVQGARLLPRRHPLQRLADRAGPDLRQHRRVDAAAARRGDDLLDPQPRLSGGVRRRRHVHHRPRTRALQPERAGALRGDEPDQGRASTTARCSARSAPPTRGRSRPANTAPASTGCWPRAAAIWSES